MTAPVPRALPADGWIALPCGGAVEIAGGVARRISDGGHQKVDEAALLREASAIVGAPLFFAALARGRRWKVKTPWRWLGLDGSASPSVARVHYDACHLCGTAAGLLTATDRHGAEGPVCRACEHDIEVHGAAFAGEGEDLTCDGTCGARPAR